MRIEYCNYDSKRESLISTLLKVFFLGWLIYFALFLIAEHFTTDIDLDFFLHDNYGNGDHDRFRDFFEVNRAAALGDCYLTGECANYPPLVLAIAKFFSLFTPSILKDPNVYVTRDTMAGKILYAVVFLGLTVLFAFLTRSYLQKNLKEAKKDKTLSWTLAVILCFSYTILFALERGNYILIALLAFLVFVFTYRDHEILSAVALAICACIKVYPVLLFLIYLIDKRYKGFFIGVATGLVGLFLPMIFLNGSLLQQFRGFLGGVLNFNNNSQATKGGVPFHYVEQHSNSFSNIFRSFALYLSGGVEPTGGTAVAVNFLSKLSSFSLLGVILISGTSLFFVKEKWKSFLILNSWTCLIPSNTYDYMLIFFLPILVLILCEGNLKNRKYVALITMLACIPKSYYFFQTGVADVSIQCVLNPLIMTIILIMIFWEDAIPGIAQKIKWVSEKRKTKKAA